MPRIQQNASMVWRFMMPPCRLGTRNDRAQSD
jgi:hypothetical protein